MMDVNYTLQQQNEPESPSVVPVKKAPTRAMLSRNVRIHNRRTSVRLEPSMWSALNEIAAAENCTIHELCTAVHDLFRAEGSSFTGTLRVFLMDYYRTAANMSPRVSQVKKLLSSLPGRTANKPTNDTWRKETN